MVDRERALDIIEALDKIAAELGISIPRLVLARTLGRPAITGVVLGARNEDQLRDNLAAVDVELPEDARRRIDELTQPSAKYPFWHRAMLATDRPDPAEVPYLDGYAALVQRS